ncbi:L,D-transpeptidase catalytic domain [Nitrosospira sp. Nsp18]|uniref:L,D-transpeptidase n=1 Tax=Nitrosospira sp. Nsp18 TaxID=1855334 RepID=UPI0008906032|nr:L,D-transpeptidase [Nitrosospira sp. Nsp18]SDA15646.1 L,D-transpeptidase catalytic domain [Nitrosospira sp. Nsp18]
MKIVISIPSQELDLWDENQNIVRKYQISSAGNGVGQEYGSFCTPLGKHIIRAKIGTSQPINTVFIRRRPTGEIYTPELGARYPGRDWILTRILWLSGCELGFNRMGKVDTMRRYIYIHGSPDSTKMGKPGSIGCIRMYNRDLLQLFDLVTTGTEVDIKD